MAEKAKAEGNEAFQNKEYDLAIAAFSRAIESDPTNHVLYSNRSGAHAAKGEYKEALLDANKCINLNDGWAKGHSRRGAAYFGLKNWPQAQAAYERGLELDPSSKAMQEGLEKVKLRRSPAAREAAGANASSTGQYQRFPGDTSGFPASGSCGTPAGPLGALAATVLSSVAVISGLFYMLPFFPRIAMLLYKVSVLSVLLLSGLNLYCAFPLKFSTLTEPKFKAAQESQGFMLLVFMLLSPPMPFALMPFLAGPMVNACLAFKPHTAKLPGPLASVIGDRVVYLTTPEGQMQARAFGAISEVICAFMAPLLCIVQGLRAAIMGFFFFQYVVRRYRTNELTVTTTNLLIDKADGLFRHRYVPAPLQNLYAKLKSFIALAANKLVQ